LHAGSIIKVGVFAALLLVGGCSGKPPRAQSIGEAFVGPAVLKIRSDVPLQSSTVATVKHGDRLELLQSRRRFLRVRTPNGVEGWTDERQLLSAADMKSLLELARRAAQMPVQGLATTYAPLNVHTQPAVGSPSFRQIKENEKFDVLMHLVIPRTDAPRKPLIPPPPKKAKASGKKAARREPRVPPPPMPKPPPLPPDWLDISKSERSEDAELPEEIPSQKPAVRVDGWSLVRAGGGQSGWVLTRLIFMAIPDEVAQYAEGKRIVSYFSLGEIQDGDQKKNIWLWTTTTDSRQPYSFDSFRVFVWSLRRHRYETAYIERNLKGYAPVVLKDVDFSTRGQVAKYPGFSICMEKKDGQRYRREYALLGIAVRFSGEHACEAPPPPPFETAGAPAAIPVTLPATPGSQPSESLLQRLKKRWHSLTGAAPGK
jgi:hypothetical protein